MNKNLLVFIGSVVTITLVTIAVPTSISASSLVPSIGFSNTSAAINTSLTFVSHSVSFSNISAQDSSVVGVSPAQTGVNNSIKTQNPSTKNTATRKWSPSPNSNSSGLITNSLANAIINTAKQYIGVPYVFGGTTPQGFDCSGFVQFVFAKNGMSLPRVSRDQFTTGEPVGLDSLQPADLVFFSLAKNGVVDHVGIYLGGGQFINAASSKGVTIYTLGSYWKTYFIGAKREL